MKSALRLTLFTLTVTLLAFGCASGRTGGQDDTAGDDAATAAATAPGGPCANVRCAECPEGQTPTLKPPDCCRCVPLDPNVTDCSNVRCASCPVGQHPALVPPDCCRCVPD
jgi:hypothetical protein